MSQVVTADVIRNLTPGLKTTFMKGWEGLPLVYEQFVTKVDSTLPSENYGWLGQAPTLREWVDERIPKGLAEYGYAIKNKLWENTIDVNRTTIEDEQYGQIALRVAQLPMMAVKGRNREVFKLLSAANSTLCYDGSNMAATTHSEGSSGTQSNLLTSSPLNAANYAIARAAMAGFKDDQGEIVGSKGTTLVVPAALEGTARALLNADFVTDGTAGGGGITNVWKGSANLVVAPWLTSATQWYLMDLDDYVRPIIFQERVTTEFAHLTNDNGSDTTFMRDKFSFGTRGRWNVGFGDWRTLVMSA